MDLFLDAYSVEGLGAKERDQLAELIDVYNYHDAKNAEKNKYYEGKIPLSDINLGIAIPEGFKDLEIDSEWGAKAVDVLGGRSMFDGFVMANGQENTQLREIVRSNRLIAEYNKGVRDELKYGCTFVTQSADPVIGSRIRFHSPEQAAALWNGQRGMIDCGFAIIDTVPDESKAEQTIWKPSIINMYTEDAVWVLVRGGYRWSAKRYINSTGRPLMDALVWHATSKKPFGRSRIKAPVRSLIQAQVRTIVNATIGLEFATSPQKYLLGVTDDQYDKLINEKFRQYVGNILAATTNPDNGEKPTFGQLQQGTVSPHVEMLRMISTQFSAATGLSVTDTGVVNDANPTSSDAINAQTQTLVGMAEQLNESNGDALYNIALTALALKNRTPIANLTDDQKDVIAHFKNPAMPSVAATADAAVKIASARAEFSKTDTFLEMLGFDQADIRRIKAQESRVRGMELLEDTLGAEG